MNPILWLATASGMATISALAWTLVHFLWEGMALAALLYVSIAFSRSSRLRYALAVSTLAVMLLAPVITFLALRQQAAVAASLSDVGSAFTALQEMGNPLAGNTTPISATLLWSNWLTWLVVTWFGGVLVFSTRALGGWMLLARLRRKENSPLAYSIVQRCSLLEQRVGVRRSIRYLQSKLLDAPAVIGWFRPAVLIPAAAVVGLSPEQLEAVIAHELAHIKRLDCFVNLFQIAAEALLFYHPAVWWVNRVIRAERENCCDDVAVSVGGDPVEYAKALTLLESSRATPAWALAANGGNLKKRISRLLGKNIMHTMPAGGVASIGVLFAAGILFAAASLPQPTQHPSDSVPAPSPVVIGAPAVEPAPMPLPAIDSPPAVPSNPWPAIAMAVPPSKEQPTASTPSGNSYIEGLRAAGLTNLSVDQLIALKVQGVTPAYINGIRAAGFNPSANEIVAMKVQGIDPAYIKEMRATGLNPNMHEIIAMKVQGMTPAYVNEIRANGLHPNTHEIIAMKVQGVDPAYIREIRASGLNPTADEITAMKVQGVTPAYIKELRADGLNPNMHEIIAMKVQGIDPAYIKAIRATGLDPNMREIIAMKVQGITPEFVEKVRSHGFKNLSVHQVIALKTAGIF
ncbi:MAG TPA: M56 family metallopeptidase [Bryobacteraceae bacterium]|jgi:beta-lactamase regulating signal transducer with metallopeptidase domain